MVDQTNPSVVSLGPADPAAIAAGQRIIGLWLFALCAMVFVMIIIGGVTRLTESGLSIVNWRPVTGWLPPLSEGAWQQLFEEYKNFPEFQKLNYDMDIGGFKGIFWLEYIHRLWGRLLGIAFAVPFAFFLFKRWIDGALAIRLGVFFVLGGAQGVLGWYMVKSGLVDDPDVSPYRLTAHLGLAVAIYAAMLWTAFGMVFGTAKRRELPRSLARMTGVISGWIFVTILSGGFVAGLNAGKTYNTFPLMDGRWIPDGLFDLSPWPRNFFENITTVQFDHRVLAVTLVCLILIGWMIAVRQRLPRFQLIGFHALGLAALVQLGLGVTTLLLVVPVSIAAIHQGGAMVLLTISLWISWSSRAVSNQ